jgi:hypothetical protein
VVHSGLDGPDGNADSSRDLWQREAEVVVEDQDGPLLDGEPSKRALELVSVIDGLVLVGPVHGLDGDQLDTLGPTPATPRLGETGVGQDPVEPRLETPRVSQRADFPPGGQQGRLDGVVSKVVVAQDPERDRHALVTGQASERIEGLSIAALRHVHQLCVHPTLRALVLVTAEEAAIGLERSRGSLAVQSGLLRRGILRRLLTRLRRVGHVFGPGMRTRDVIRIRRTTAVVLVATVLAVAGCGNDAPSPSAGDDVTPAASIADLSAIACATDDPTDVGELSGAWLGSEGGVYYIRQVGDCLWWFGTDVRDIEPGQTDQSGFANVASGRVDGNRIEVEWADLPLGDTLGGGGLTLVYDAENDQLTRIEQRGDWLPFGATTFTRIEPDTSPAASPSVTASP